MTRLAHCIIRRPERALWAYASWDKSAQSIARRTPYLGGFAHWDAGKTPAHGVALIAARARTV